MKTYKELNYWCKKVWGIPFWALILVAGVVEYGLSFVGAK